MHEEATKIKAVAMDVDGVLTDGTVWWGPQGDEYKRFCFADMTGITQALRAGIKIALVSGDSTDSGMALVQRLANRLKIVDVYKGCHDKERAVREFALKYGIALSELCFIGDDFIDAPAMEIVGLAIAPADAQKAAIAKAHIVTRAKGGKGAVREVLNTLFEAKSWETR